MVLLKIFIRKQAHRSTGFTLVEVLLVLALMSVLAFTTMIFTLGSYTSARLHYSTTHLSDLLTTARSDAMNDIGGVAHGVAFYPAGYNGWVLFAGANYLAADNNTKVFVAALTGITLGSSTPAEIIFSRRSGDSNYSGTLVVYHGVQSSSTIKINYEGAISY